MIKKILLFLFIMSMAFTVNAQTLRPSGLPTTNSPSRYDVTGYQRDSAFLYVLRDSFPAKYPSVIYHPNGNLYKTEGGTGAFWSLITDTTWLSNRIDLKLNIADTAAALSNYLRKTDTANLVAPYMKYSDTSNMLTPYHQSFYTATFDTATRILTMYPITGTVPTILSIPRGGSITGITSLTPYRVPGSDVQYLVADNGDAPGFTLKTADSATIMHFSDTATMLSPYAHSQAVVKYYDTSAMLSKYVRYTDTANIVANRLKISDTATMLSNRLKISDTANMLAGYKTYYPRTAISGGSGITYDPVTGIISNGSPSSGGTVTSVSAGVGMNFTTITTTGPVNADTLVLSTRLHVDSIAMRKLNLTDTAAMLSNRLKISDTATMLRNHATYAETLTGKNISGSVNNLSNIANSSLVNSTISGIPLGSNLAALTNGFGITSLSYNGSTAKVVTVDTSSGGVATWALLKKKIDSASAAGGGSVSSVGLVLPTDVFTVTGSPVTTSGNLTGTFKTQTANKVFASDASGSTAQPTFRALVAADLPDLSGTYLPIIAGSGNPLTGQLYSPGLQINGFDLSKKMYIVGDGRIDGSLVINDSLITSGYKFKVHGKMILDSLDDGDLSDSAIVWDNTTHSLRKIIQHNGTVTLVTASLPLSITDPTTTPNIIIDSTNSIYGYTTLYKNSLKLNSSNISGSSGYVGKFTNTNSVGNSIIFIDNGRVGINTTLPADTVEIAGNLFVRGSAEGIRFGGTSLGFAFANAYDNVLGATKTLGLNTTGARTMIGTATDDAVNALQVGGTITSNNNSIIGKTEFYNDNSTKLASTAWAKHYADSVGSIGVTSVSVVTANGVSGSVANPTTTPAITLTLGNITPSSVVSSGAITATTFNGAGTGITGTATSLNIGGTAASETLATVATRGNSYSGSLNLGSGTRATVGDVLNFANNKSIAWRNAANSADLQLFVNGSDVLRYTGNALFDGSLTAGAITGTSIVKSGGTSSQALIADGSVLTLTNGTYTPTISNTSNVASSSASEFQYMRVGNTVTVSGSVTATATSGVSTIALEITLPIASTFTQNYQCAGTGAGASGLSAANTLMVVNADTSTHLAYCQVFPGGTASTQYWLHFTYQIL